MKRERAKKAPAPPGLLTAEDFHLFNEGTHLRLYDKLGARRQPDGKVHFAVWAPDAREVSVIGDFNGWKPDAFYLSPQQSSGIWAGSLDAKDGAAYKYRILPKTGGPALEKCDPFALFCEVPPKTASVIWDISYPWRDGEWMRKRGKANALGAPMAVYEVHLGSWMRVPEDGGRSLNYRELCDRLPAYVEEMGFTHVEFLPLMEHPFYGSWGYQTTGYFAPTSRYGTPQDFMRLIDSLHARGIGVILDWVPSHFPTDGHSLGRFDGTALYEHADERQGHHPDWKTYIFNYGRNEVRSFLASSALFWLEHYHADALRVDAVASMLYLDYSRKAGEWIPNKFGGRENLEAIDFLRGLNTAAYREHPDTQMIAEESTAWPMVSRPVHLGGLGFGLKWDMGWMHDTLEYFAKDPVHRRHHHNEITFRMIYAFHENFMLPLSHDEVVHGKGSLLRRMPGDDWQRFANLRTLLSYMYAQPGKKLLFMGGEFGQSDEWNHEKSLDWHLLEHAPHAGLKRMVRDLNHLYRKEPALHELDCDPKGFEWLDANDSHQSVLCFLRSGQSTGDAVAAVANFTPVPRAKYRIGVPRGGYWREIFNSDAKEYGGSGQGNPGLVQAEAFPYHGRQQSLTLTLPPLSFILLKSDWRGE